MARTPVNLFAFGSKSKGPRAPRPGIDLFPNDDGMVEAEMSASAQGASAFADIAQCLLTGHYFLLPAGTDLPEGLAVVADGQDSNSESAHPRTHHTIYPSKTMTFERFVELFKRLPWQYAGKKT
jgi:hypothetical protein